MAQRFQSLENWKIVGQHSHIWSKIWFFRLKRPWLNEFWYNELILNSFQGSGLMFVLNFMIAKGKRRVRQQA